MEKKYLLKINPKDNVAVALFPVKQDSVLHLNEQELIAREDIPRGHKIALTDIEKGQDVRKFGYSIGKATNLIQKGCWVHTHNLQTGLEGKIEYEYKPIGVEVANVEKDVPTFWGYKRQDGRVGIRNEIWVINTVGCINKSVETIVLSAREKYRENIEMRSIDGIFSFAHPYGCSQLGGDLEKTQKILAGLVRHPNAAGVLVVGLGCENNQLGDFKKVIGGFDGNRVRFLNLQDVEDEETEALTRIGSLIEYAKGFKREEVPVSKLKIGLKCGGSDSLSGITANPLVGRISDKLVSYGGTTILSEVPEMFGAETILMSRAPSEEIFQQIVHLINEFKDYFISHGQSIYENPAPGNKEGGITTLEEKSLGNIEKGGNGSVNGVNLYGDMVNGHGLQLLESPGNDMVSTTALTAAGAQIVLFTTGRGTPFGGPVPTVKISTNSELYKKKGNWIDFDAGKLIGGVTMEQLADEFFDYLIRVASGEERTRNEVNGFREISILKDGVTL